MQNRWCFTANNPGEWRPTFSEKTMNYMVFQLESAPTTGTLHIQGYVRFKGKKRLETVKRALGRPDAHVEPARGTEEENRNYCTKEPRASTPTEYGVYDPQAGKQGRRMDLEQACSSILAGSSLVTVAKEQPDLYVKYHQGLHSLAQIARPLPPLERQLRVIVLWGTTGTGKTHRVMMTYPEIYTVVPGRDPWYGYTGQKQVVFDEFDPGAWKLTEMNRYLDKWRCPLDKRYHNQFAEWNLVIICANSNPRSWYETEYHQYPLLWQAFMRRIEGGIVFVESREMEIDLTTPDSLPPLQPITVTIDEE